MEFLWIKVYQDLAILFYDRSWKPNFVCRYSLICRVCTRRKEDCLFLSPSFFVSILSSHPLSPAYFEGLPQISHLITIFISREMRKETHVATGLAQLKAWRVWLPCLSTPRHVHSLSTGRSLFLASFHILEILDSRRKAGFSSQVADRVFLIFFLAGIKLLAPLLFVSGHEPWLPDCPGSEQGSILLKEECILHVSPTISLLYVTRHYHMFRPEGMSKLSCCIIYPRTGVHGKLLQVALSSLWTQQTFAGILILQENNMEFK